MTLFDRIVLATSTVRDARDRSPAVTLNLDGTAYVSVGGWSDVTPYLKRTLTALKDAGFPVVSTEELDLGDDDCIKMYALIKVQDPVALA